MPTPIQHEDFGEKIGGAKKDLWSERGLYADDLSQMNSREADKYVKKDNVWKKPDYQAMIDSGTPVDVAFFIKKVRDSLNAAPQYYRADDTPEKRLARQKQYVETVREVQAVVEGVKTRAEAMRAYTLFLVDGGYVQRVDGISGPRYTATDKGQENPVITNKLARTLHIRSEAAFEHDFTLGAQAEQFGVPKEDKVPRGYDIRFNNGKGSYSRSGDWQPDTYYVTKGHQILQTNLATREAALKWVQEFAKQRGSGGKKRFVPEQLTNVRRDGPDYRHGQDVSGQDYMDAFGFRGGEFGNWMSQNDRQASLNMGFDALKDLAAALRISEKDIAYQGALSIAFGARGSGNAVAHYEPLRQVINLTKMRGAGSLAHEWWHGLDDYLGRKLGAGDYLSEKPRAYPLFQKLIDTIKYKPETPEQAAVRTEKTDARTRGNAERWLDSTMLYTLQRKGDEAVLAEYGKLKVAFLSGEQGAVDRLSDFRKLTTGHVIPKSERETLSTYERMLCSMAERTEISIGRTETDYFRNSKAMGQSCEKDGGYWESNVEMTARAFACYVKDRLPNRSDYLCGHAECCVDIVFDKDGNSEVIKAFPQGEERAAINAVMDEIVADLKRQQYLTHADAPLPLPDRLPEAVRGQITLFTAEERPSVLGQLAASKAQGTAAPKQAPPIQRHEAEL